jgi:hypothetical protein
MQSLTYRRVALVIETNDPQYDPADEDMKQLYEDLPDTLLILEDQVYTEQNSRHFRIKFLLLFIGLYVAPLCAPCHTRFQGVGPSAYHMCARIHFHTYVDVTSVIYQKTMQ